MSIAVRVGASAALALSLAACVGVPPERLPVVENPGPSFPEPSPVRHLAGRRFVVRATSEALARESLGLAERAYDRVMAHTGLWSFKPAGLYPIVVYRDAGEYLEKTGQPEWSGGVAVGRAIYTYEGPQLSDTIAHEVTHLVFYEHGSGPRWLNEGLAVYEEIEASPPERRAERLAELDEAAPAAMPFDAMVRFSPASERERLVSLWYLQAAGVARFLVQRGGPGAIAKFLDLTRRGTGLDASLAQSFPTLCGDLASLEAAWRRR